MLTCGISLERYITVCHPFFKINHRWPASLYLIPIGVFSLAFTLPKYYEFKVVDINFHSVGNQSEGEEVPSNFTIYSLQPTKLRLDPTYVNLYIMWSMLIVQGIFPYVVLLAMNICIFRTMRVIQREEYHGGVFIQQRNKEVGVSKISILIVLVFMVCNSLKWIPTIWELTQSGRKLHDYEWPDWIEKIRTMSNLLITLSGSLTPLVYIIRQRQQFSCQSRQATSCQADQIELSRRISRLVTHEHRRWLTTNELTRTPSTILNIHLRTNIKTCDVVLPNLKASRSLNLETPRNPLLGRSTSDQQGVYLELPSNSSHVSGSLHSSDTCVTGLDSENNTNFI